jgi:hypothetical protein
LAVFEEEHISPGAVELAEALSPADDAKAAGVVEGNAGGVLWEDTGLDGPDPGCLGGLDEGGEQEPSNATALVGGVDANAVLDDPGVTAAVRDATGRYPTRDLVAVGGHEAETGPVAGVPVLPGGWSGLEGGVARGDPGA